MSIAWSSTTPEMEAAFSRKTEVQSWRDFEAALARVQATVGHHPEAAARDISAKATVERFDLDRLRERSAPHRPLVRVLAGHVRESNGEYVHWGARCQDVRDTGLVLRLKRADATIRRELEELTGG